MVSDNRLRCFTIAMHINLWLFLVYLTNLHTYILMLGPSVSEENRKIVFYSLSSKYIAAAIASASIPPSVLPGKRRQSANLQKKNLDQNSGHTRQTRTK